LSGVKVKLVSNVIMIIYNKYLIRGELG